MSGEPIIVLGPKTSRRVRCTPIRKRRGAVLGIAAGLGLAFAAAAVLTRGTEAFVTVKRGDLVLSLIALGRVEADPTLEIVPKITARILAVHVQEGESVKAGQTLVTLEDAPLRAQHEEAQRARDAARSRWDELIRGSRAEDLERARAQVAGEEQAVRLAEARKAETFRGARTEEREEAEAQMAVATAEAEFARKDFERISRLADEGVLSERERDEAKRRRDSAEALLRQAKAKRDRVVHGASDEEKAQADAAVEVARAGLEQAKAVQARLVHGATEEERRTVEAEFRRAEAVVARLQFEIEQTKLLSPVDGVVARRYREPSELAGPGMAQPILVVAGNGARVIRAEVQETDIWKLRVGQTGEILSDSYPGRRWTGTVTRIAPAMGKKILASENPKEKSDVKVLEIRISPSAPLDLPLNLPVEVRICEIVRPDVLLLPVRLLGRDGGVRLSDGSTRKIETGARDDAFVEIVSGLSEGDRVVPSP